MEAAEQQPGKGRLSGFFANLGMPEKEIALRHIKVKIYRDLSNHVALTICYLLKWTEV